MIIRNQKTFNTGLLLAVSFIGVLVLIFMPIFGKGNDGKDLNGLEFSDDLFNKLAKGSAYFIPAMAEEASKFKGKNVEFAVKMDSPEQAEKAGKLLMPADASVNVQGANIKVSGDLGKILINVLQDSDVMYWGYKDVIKTKYELGEKGDERDALQIPWTMMKKAVKELQKEKKIDEANVMSEVMKKGIEPAFNFYGIQPQRVLDRAGIMTTLLLFYVLYTMWWGYAIFYMFDGIGLSMKKSKVKKEV